MATEQPAPSSPKNKSTIRMSGFFSHHMNDLDLKKELKVKCDHATMDCLVSILKKPAFQRNTEEVSHVLNLIKDLKFFKDRNIADNDLQEITKVLSIERFAPGEVIMNYGEKGDKFYVIVQGLALVRIPNPNIRNWRQKHFFKLQNEAYLRTVMKKYSKRFGSMPVVKGLSRNLSEVEELNKLNESQYQSFMHDIICKLQMHENEEQECKQIAESYLEDIQQQWFVDCTRL